METVSHVEDLCSNCLYNKNAISLDHISTSCWDCASSGFKHFEPKVHKPTRLRVELVITPTSDFLSAMDAAESLTYDMFKSEHFKLQQVCMIME